MSDPSRSGVAAAARRIGGSPLFDRAVDAMERLYRGDASTFVALTYHRVDRPEESVERYPGLISATPPSFDDQVREVVARWNPISLEQVVAMQKGGRVPPRSVLFTFDDAYDDFERHAWPVLRRHGVPAVMFVPTAFPGGEDTTFWWDDLHDALRGGAGVVMSPVGPVRLEDAAGRDAAFRAIRAWFKSTAHEIAIDGLRRFFDRLGYAPRRAPVLGWETLRRLAREGLALAPHSVTHAMLDRLDDAGVRREIEGSRDMLRQETGVDSRAFAYPSGQHDDRVVALAREAGVDLAFTTRRGANRNDSDWLRLARINVSHRSPFALTRAQMLGPVARIAARLD